MASPEPQASFDMENQEEKASSIVDRWRYATIHERGNINNEESKKTRTSTLLNEIWTARRETFKENFPMWKIIFAISCVLAVSFDPLFFYIPIINESNKCIRLDKKLKTTALVIRSVTDFNYILDIVSQICTRHKPKTFGVSKSKKGVWEKAKTISWSYILINVLAVLPFPQVVIFLFFSNKKSSRSLNTWKFLSSLAMLQYVPRVLRTYLSLNKLHLKIGVWVQVAFSFCPIILASHVLGSIWYFLAIQRQTTCWQYACRSENECASTSFDCNDYSFTNITLLNDSCPIDPPNATLFNFGIYLNALHLGSTNFWEKFLYCLWWGLQNLSSLGQNLQTSTDASENIFAVLTFLSGMLLFVFYVNEIMQIRNRWETKRLKKHGRMMRSKDLEVQMWLSNNGLPTNLKSVIMQYIEQELKENKDVDVKDNILSILPSKIANYIKRSICLARLKKVQVLQTVDEQVLEEICKLLKPMIYTGQDNYIIKAGEPLDKMLFILQGAVRTYIPEDSSTIETPGTGSPSTDLEMGDLYGEELLVWASKFTFTSDLPISTRNVKALEKAEVFVLMAGDLENVFSKFWWHFRRKAAEISHPPDSNQLEHQFENFASSSIIAAFRRRRNANVKSVPGIPATQSPRVGGNQSVRS